MYTKFYKYALCVLAAATFFSSCENATRTIDLELPKVESKLVLEGYVIPGTLYALSLTRSQPYFDAIDDCIIVKDATVIVHYMGQADTLEEAPTIGACKAENAFGIIPFLSPEGARAYNYGDYNKIYPKDFNNEFRVEVIDEKGDRYTTATTKLLPPVGIDSFEVDANRDSLRRVIFYVDDDENARNFYRVTLHRLTADSLNMFGYNYPDLDITYDDADFALIDNAVPFGTGYDYNKGDTLIFTTYHINESYYDFLTTIDAATNANGNPFAQPAAIKSNVQGGHTGIYTAFIPKKDTLVIK